MPMDDEIRRLESNVSREGFSLVEYLSSLSSSDIRKLQDEDVLRYVAKYSKNTASRKKAVSELIRMESSQVLEYIALTSNFDETRKSAIKGLSRLSDTDSLKRLIAAGDERVVQEACAGLFRNMDSIIRSGDTESLELMSKFSKRRKQKKLASNWLEKIRVIKMIKKIEA